LMGMVGQGVGAATGLGWNPLAAAAPKSPVY
jgi:hypothetical protein